MGDYEDNMASVENMLNYAESRVREIEPRVEEAKHELLRALEKALEVAIFETEDQSSVNDLLKEWVVLEKAFIKLSTVVESSCTAQSLANSYSGMLGRDYPYEVEDAVILNKTY